MEDQTCLATGISTPSVRLHPLASYAAFNGGTDYDLLAQPPRLQSSYVWREEKHAANRHLLALDFRHLIRILPACYTVGCCVN